MKAFLIDHQAKTIREIEVDCQEEAWLARLWCLVD